MTFSVVGDDVVLTVNTPFADGTIRLEGAGELVDPTHGFTVWTHAFEVI